LARQQSFASSTFLRAFSIALKAVRGDCSGAFTPAQTGLGKRQGFATVDAGLSKWMEDNVS
jgi:hypothetical protein